MKIYTITHSRHLYGATLIKVIAESEEEAMNIFYSKYENYDRKYMRSISEKPLKKGVLSIEID